MAQPRNPQGKFVKANDSLKDFTAAMEYRDGPLVGLRGDSGYAKDWRTIYGASWIAKQAVERIPEDCFRKGYNWVADSKQVSLIESVEKRFKIRQKKKQAMIMARLEGEAYLYFDTGDDSSQPLSLDRVSKNGLKFVNLFGKSKLRQGPTVNDALSEYYGLPEYYTINETQIHPSRICRFVANEDPVTGQGRSVLQHTLGVILAAETTRDNTVALTTQARMHIMKVCGLMDAVADPTTRAQIVERYALFKQQIATNNMAVLDKEGEDYSSSQPAYTQLPEVIETMRREVSAALEIPHALLFGRESGLGTNGEMELATYYDNIQSMQVTEIQPACESLDEVIIRSALGSRPEEVYLEWQSLWQMSDKERAEIADVTADTVTKLVNSGVLPAEILTLPTITALSEQGALPGLEAQYNEWIAGGGDSEDDDLGDDNGSNDAES